LDTAAASAPPADPPIGASAIGCRMPNSSVNAVHNAMVSILATIPRPVQHDHAQVRVAAWVRIALGREDADDGNVPFRHQHHARRQQFHPGERDVGELGAVAHVQRHPAALVGALPGG
jgi:hypothetical protein